jgi:ABC-2 type transport system permease protein
MIGLLLSIHWLNLKRDRVALVLAFVLPVAFFSLFTSLFGGLGAGVGEANPVQVLVVDADHTGISRWFVTALEELKALRVVLRYPLASASQELTDTTRDAISEAIRAGDYAVAVLIPRGFGAALTAFNREATGLEVFYNPANPMARFMLGGVLQGAALKVAPALLLQQGITALERFRDTLAYDQRQGVETILHALRSGTPWHTFSSVAETAVPRPPGAAGEPPWLSTALQYTELVNVPIRMTDVRGQGGSLVAYYAAGIGVMFMLFSMAAAGGSLLEEQESGTLERLLNSRLRIGTLLVGKWLFYTVLAIVQLLVMFVWGAVVFDLDLWTVNRLTGFFAMAVVAATAAAAFGIVLAVLCKSRAQLNGVSSIVILLMSALGGSMAPRFVMPAFMDTVAKFTFNGWALDGFLKVFWYDNPRASLLQSVTTLWPEMTVLVGLTCVFLLLAYVVARRWETV